MSSLSADLKLKCHSITKYDESQQYCQEGDHCGQRLTAPNKIFR